MKPIFLALIFCIGVCNGFAGEVKVFAGARFDAKAWDKLQTYDVRTLSRKLDSHVGQLIELRFQFRSKDVRHLKPNWFQASVWQMAPEGWRRFLNVPVMVAAGDVSAFKAFSTDSRSTADLKVYGQVLYDFDADFAFVRLIGTNVFVDSEGFTNVSW